MIHLCKQWKILSAQRGLDNRGSTVVQWDEGFHFPTITWEKLKPLRCHIFN